MLLKNFTLSAVCNEKHIKSAKNIIENHFEQHPILWTLPKKTGAKTTMTLNVYACGCDLEPKIK